MTPFELIQPRSLPEALHALRGGDPDVRPFAGGTALMLLMKAAVLKPRCLVVLRHLARDHAGIALTRHGELAIGALATLAGIEQSALVRDRMPVLNAVMRRLANVRVRNVATLGGSLAHADPHMDLPPLLVALDASATLVSPRGERRMPVEALISGYLQTEIAGDELMTEVTIPIAAGARAAYLKCTSRSADDWPALGVAVRLDGRDGAMSCRIVLGSATQRPTRAVKAEAEIGAAGPHDPAAVRRAAEAAAAEVNVHSDGRGSAAYKRQLVRVYVTRAIAAACDARPAGTPGADSGSLPRARPSA